jgi:hypothetical protein
MGAMANERIDLLERVGVQEVIDALSRGEFPLRALCLDGPLRASVLGLLLAVLELGQTCRHDVVVFVVF